MGIDGERWKRPSFRNGVALKADDDGVENNEEEYKEIQKKDRQQQP